MKNLLILITFVLFTFSCQIEQKDELTTLKEEVMAMHDEVMPKMSELRYTQKALMLQVDSLMSSDSLRSATLIGASNEIIAANEAMMNWMRNYEPDYQGTKEEIISYLEQQKEAIQKVKNDMERSLENGKQLLVVE